MMTRVLRKLGYRSRVRTRSKRPPDTATGASGGASPEPGSGLWDLLGRYIPNDHARQVNARWYLDRVMSGPDPPRRVLDLGCGSGNSVDWFRGHDPAIDWVGVDIADSQEARARRRTDAVFMSYDGVRVPFDDRTFDLVYSSQVLEHVPDPAVHLREIARVLRPGGILVGSTSQLEPYHSMSYWNITPFGFVRLAEAAGLEVRELRPGIDGITLTLRAFLGRPPGFNTWWTSESPLNAEIDDWGRQTGRRPALVNLRKLQVSGQYAFLATRAAGGDA
jgi:SAM-dependent methyltransferase